MSMSESATGGEPSPGLRSVLDSHAGRGQPLPDTVRETLEPRMRADLSDVRVHADGEAHRMATGLGARAFTYGSDIYFRDGAYDPAGSDGRKTLAHEVAHTVQQREASRTVQRQIVSGDAALAFLRRHHASVEVEGTMSIDPSRSDVYRAIIGQTARVAFSSRSLTTASHGSPHATMRASAESSRAYLPQWHVQSPSGSIRDYGQSRSIAVELSERGRYRIAALVGEPGGAAAPQVWMTRFVDVETRHEYTSRETADVASSEYRPFAEHAMVSTFDSALREAIIAEQEQTGAGQMVSMSGARDRSPALRMTGPPNPVALDGPVRGLEFHLHDGERSPRLGVAESIEWFVVFRGSDGTPDTSTRRFDTEPVSFSFAGLEMVGYRLAQRSRQARLSFGEGRAPSWLTVVARVSSPAGVLQEAKREQFFVDEDSASELLRERVDEARTEAGGLIPMRAAHFDGAGRRRPLHLYVGVQPNGMYVLFDLTLGAEHGRYEGLAMRTLLERVGGHYPPGYLYAEVGANELGVAPQSHAVEATGVTEAARLAGGLGVASLGLAAGGVFAMVIPGAQPLAPFFFAASTVAGGVSSTISLSEHLGADRVDQTAVALDLLALAGALVGASAARISPFTNVGRGLRVADLALNAVDGVVFTDTLAGNLYEAAIAEGTDDDRIRHVMVLLAQGIVGGALMFQSARSTAGELRVGIDRRHPTARAGGSAVRVESGEATPRVRDGTPERAPRLGTGERPVRIGEEAPSDAGAHVRFVGDERQIVVVEGTSGPEFGFCTRCGSLLADVRAMLDAVGPTHPAVPRLERLRGRIVRANRELAARTLAGRPDPALDLALQNRFADDLRAVSEVLDFPALLPSPDSGGTRVLPSPADLAAHRPLGVGSRRGTSGVPMPPGLDVVDREVWNEYGTYYNRREAALRAGTSGEGPLTFDAYRAARRGPVRGMLFERRVGPAIEGASAHAGDIVQHQVRIAETGGTDWWRPDTLVVPRSAPATGPIDATVYFQRSHDWTAANVRDHVDADVASAVAAYRGRRTISRAPTSVGPVPGHPHSGREIRVTTILMTYDARRLPSCSASFGSG